jgi:predicted DNA-binding transcriptional regulator AlpA
MPDFRAVPSLDELALHPEQAAELSVDVVLSLHARAVRALMALEAPLLAVRANGRAASSEPNAGDRFLDAVQVGAMIGKSKSWVEKNTEALPKRRKVGGEGMWSEREIQTWMKHRETWD